MTAVSDLPAVPMSLPIRLPTSIPQSAEASNTFMQEDTTSQAIVPISSNFALAQTHANTSAMGASERNSMQAQIDALRNQLSWTQNVAEQYVYEEKMKAARTVQEALD